MLCEESNAWSRRNCFCFPSVFLLTSLLPFLFFCVCLSSSLVWRVMWEFGTRGSPNQLKCSQQWVALISMRFTAPFRCWPGRHDLMVLITMDTLATALLFCSLFRFVFADLLIFAFFVYLLFPVLFCWQCLTASDQIVQHGPGRAHKQREISWWLHGTENRSNQVLGLSSL